MSGPPVHYDCDECCCAPCVCDQTVEDDECADERPTITFDEFIAAEFERLHRFRRWWQREMNKPENVTPEGEPMFPSEMPEGEWDQQMLAFDDMGDEE